MSRLRPCLVLALALFTAACGQVEIESRWRVSPLIIDGRADDWADALIAFDDSGVSLGIQNDGDFLYLCFLTADRRLLAPVLRSGLVIWLDPKGGKDKVLGIRFPLGLEGRDFQGPESGNRDRQDAIRGLQSRRDELEILGPGRDEVVRLKRSELKGLEVAVSNRDGFAYEMRIPLAAGPDASLAAGISPGRPLGIGITSAEPDLRRLSRGGRDGGIGMGGRGGMRGGMTAGMGGRSRMGGQGRVTLKIWIKAALASPPERP